MNASDKIVPGPQPIQKIYEMLSFLILPIDRLDCLQGIFVHYV